MELVLKIIGFLILLLLLRRFWGKYIQWQVLRKFRRLTGVLKNDKSKIDIDEYVSFISSNINLAKDSFFEEKIRSYTSLFNDEYKSGIAALDIFTSWVSNLKNEIIYDPYSHQNQYRAGEYQRIYESENKNIFEKIEYGYKSNILEGIDNDTSKNKLFFLRLNNAIELFLSKYAQSSDTLLIFYWFDFYPFFLKNINKISYKTWFSIDSFLNEKH